MEKCVKESKIEHVSDNIQNAIIAYSFIILWVYFRMALRKNPFSVRQQGAPVFGIFLYKENNLLTCTVL